MPVAAESELRLEPSLERGARAGPRGQRRPGPRPLRRRLRDAGLGLPQAARRRARGGALLPARVGRAGPGRPLLLRRPAAARAAALERRGALGVERRGGRRRRRAEPQPSRRPIPTRAVAARLGELPAGPGRGPAAVRRRRRRLLRLRPGAHGRAARRAEPRPARAARHGADGHRRDARLRPPAPRADDPRLRLRRRRGRDRRRLRARRRDDRRRCASACAAPSRRPTRPRVAEPPEFVSNMEREEFEAAVARIVEYVHAGDAFQVVPSQRFSAPAPVEAFSVYRGLRAVNPSPYMYFLEFGDFQIAGASPEPLVKVSGDRVETRPIAGTSPRGRSEEEDRRLAERLDQRPQGAGRARDAGRPRPQRPRPRLRVRHASRSTS